MNAMKTFLTLGLCLLILGGIAGYLGYSDYSFSNQEPHDANTMKLEDYSKGQRIDTEVEYAYDYYAFMESYNTFLGIKTTKSREEERYYLVPITKVSETDGYTYIDYFMTFIVPANQCDKFDELVQYFWGNVETASKATFTGKVEAMNSDTRDLLIEYFNEDFNSEENPGVSEYQYLIEMNMFEGENIDTEYINSRLADYCIRFRADNSSTTGLIIMSVGAVVFAAGAIFIIIAVLKKKKESEPSFY